MVALSLLLNTLGLRVTILLFVSLRWVVQSLFHQLNGNHNRVEFRQKSELCSPLVQSNEYVTTKRVDRRNQVPIRD